MENRNLLSSFAIFSELYDESTKNIFDITSDLN